MSSILKTKRFSVQPKDVIFMFIHTLICFQIMKNKFGSDMKKCLRRKWIKFCLKFLILRWPQSKKGNANAGEWFLFSLDVLIVIFIDFFGNRYSLKFKLIFFSTEIHQSLSHLKYYLISMGIRVEEERATIRERNRKYACLSFLEESSYYNTTLY